MDGYFSNSHLRALSEWLNSVLHLGKNYKTVTVYQYFKVC